MFCSKLTILPLILSSSIFAEEIKVQVFNPSDNYPKSYSKEFAGKPIVYKSVKPLILTMQEAQNGDFIESSDANPTLKWRLQHVIIISEDVISVRFSEGHADVIGVFVRDIEKKQWELKAEVGGSFKFGVLDAATGKPKI